MDNATTFAASGGINLFWESPGPVSSAYKASTAKKKGIMGPVGGGKTTTTFHCLLDIAQTMPPDRDGVAKCKFAIIRDTIRNLNRTTLKTWQRIVSPKIGRSVGASGSEPGFHEFVMYVPITLDPADETSRMMRSIGNLGAVTKNGVPCRKIEVRLEFFALGDNDVESILRGLECTAAFVNECDLMPEDIFTFLEDRVGRYPERNSFNSAALDRVPGYGMILFDFNAPAPDNWLYKLWFERDLAEWLPALLMVFVQPGGRAPGAENIKNLRQGYYDTKGKNRKPWYTRRMIDNEPCYGRGTALVFEEWSDQWHVAPAPLMPVPGLPIYLSIDNGLRPGCVGAQRVGQQWRFLFELWYPHIGPKTFGDMLNRRLTRDYAGFTFQGTGDPAAFYGDTDSEDLALATVVARIVGVKFRPAPTNALGKRFDAVRDVLRAKVDDSTLQPRFLLSPTMIVARAGFNGQYHYPKNKGNEGADDDEPVKNHPWSDIQDCIQYLICKFGDFHEAEARQARSSAGAAKRVIQAKVGFNVFH